MHIYLNYETLKKNKMKTISKKTCIVYQPRHHFEPPLRSCDQKSVAEEKCLATDVI